MSVVVTDYSTRDGIVLPEVKGAGVYSFFCGRCGTEYRGFNPGMMATGFCGDCLNAFVKEANVALPPPTSEETADYALYMIEQMCSPIESQKFSYLFFNNRKLVASLEWES